MYFPLTLALTLASQMILTKTLPGHLRSDLMVHITSAMVLKCSFFASCESGFIRQVMLSLEQRFFSTQFMIMTAETPTDGMYFVKNGVVELLKVPTSGEGEVSNNHIRIHKLN